MSMCAVISSLLFVRSIAYGFLNAVLAIRFIQLGAASILVIQMYIYIYKVFVCFFQGFETFKRTLWLSDHVGGVGFQDKYMYVHHRERI